LKWQCCWNARRESRLRNGSKFAVPAVPRDAMPVRYVHVTERANFRPVIAGDSE
jgi:hypothetical protein